MIEHILRLSIRQRLVVLILVVGVCILGVQSLLKLPIDAVPDLSENQVIVFADWPGHAPGEVERHVTYPLSLLLQGLEGVRVVRGSSDVGYSMIHVIFNDDVTFRDARREVQNRITDAGLCHGWAGLLHTARRVASDTLTATTSAPAAGLDAVTRHLLTHLDTGHAPPPGFLEGAAGVALALHATTTSPLSGWDACLLIA